MGDRVLAKYFLAQLIAVVALWLLLAPAFVMPLLKSVWFEPFDERLQKFRAGGALLLAADALDTLPEADQQLFVQRIQQWLPYVIHRQDLATLKLSDTDRARLQTQQLVFIHQTRQLLTLLSDQKRLLVIEDIDNAAPHVMSDTELECLGVLALLQWELQQHPQSQWRRIINAKSSLFDYPVDLVTLDSLSLEEGQLRRLVDGKVVAFKTTAEQVYGSGVDRFYQRVADSRWVISGGPVSTAITGILQRRNKLSLLFLSAVIILPLIIWLLPTWRSMNQLSIATQSFKQGCFDASVKVIPGSHLNRQALQFNHMAAKIRDLFRKNKILVHEASHDLEAPLHEIEQALQQMNQHNDKANVEQQAAHIEHALDQLNYLTTNILLSVRDNAGR
jgi:two-component system sensor histidine kinase RstB